MDIKAHNIRLDAVARFRELRRELHSGVADFAAVLGVSPATIYRWEDPDHESSPPARLIILLAIRYDISPTWLMCGVGSKHLSEVKNNHADNNDARDRALIDARIVSAAKALGKLEKSIARIEAKKNA
jgi:transcriptional regulator with XRE-family HTH domain